MSECLTAYCLAHQRKVFLQGWGPDAGLWCHASGWPCAEDPNEALAEVRAH